MRQNSGDGSVNSNPTSLLLPLFSLMNATVHVSSSTVFEFTMETCCPRITGVSIETRHPFAFTVLVLVSSSNGLPLLMPRTITAI